MSKLTTLSIHVTNVYQIRNFFDEDHFPKLKTLSFNNGYLKSSVLSHLKLWWRHRGVASLSLTINYWSSKEEKEFWDHMVQIFPAVKQFELKMYDGHYIPMKRSMESFKTWDLERVKVLMECVSKSSVLTQVLKAVSTLKGKIQVK